MRILGYKRQIRKNPIFETNLSINDEFDRVIEEACFPNGKIGIHQRRVGRKKLNEFKDVLILLEKSIKECNDFDSIYKVIFDAKIKGIGELSVYDISFRLGKMAGVYPDKVYLHAGTRKGAVNLGIITANDKSKYIDSIFDKNENDYIERIYVELRQLEPYEIEDYLCRDKDYFISNNFKLK